jgi:7-cyano-7-deazaguanine synthase
MVAAAVLLSGGLDSTIALHHALSRRHDFYAQIAAWSLMYGQDNADAELAAAGACAKRNGVPWLTLSLADAVARVTAAPSPGLSPAYRPSRNLLMLSVVASHAAARFVDHRIDIFVGCCAADAAGFPDCRPGFLLAAGHALGLGLVRDVNVVAPLVDRTKSQGIDGVRDMPGALRDVARSWSCYRAGPKPCGVCTPCVLRREAFSAQNIADESHFAGMTGGDGPTVKEMSA